MSLYPAISICVLVLAARLVVTAGDRSPAFRLLLGGTIALLAHDILSALDEVNSLDLSPALLDVVYLLVPASISLAVLHPSIRFVTRAARRRESNLGRGRLVAVAGALLAPIAVVATSDTAKGTVVTIGLCLILSVTAIVRLHNAMRQQAALESRLSHQATHDELTGLPSRSFILTHTDDMLAASETTGEPVAVMFVDLDQFKLVNDSMGHGMGDQLLILAARRISSCMRPQDLVGRISGDEFVVVVDLDSAQAFSLGERIRRVPVRASTSMPARCSSPCRSVSPSPMDPTAPKHRRSSRKRTRRCTGPRMPAATASPSSIRRCGNGLHAGSS